MQLTAAITIGPAGDPAVTHLLPHQIINWLGISRTTFAAWKKAHDFPYPVLMIGMAFYPRVEIEAWKCSRAAPRWLQGRAVKPLGAPVARSSRETCAPVAGAAGRAA